MTADEIDLRTAGATSLAALRQHAQELIKTAGRPVRSVRLRAGDDLIEVEWADGPGTLTSPPARGIGPSGIDEPGDEVTGGPALVEVTSPLVGTFYQAPEPGSEPFVTEGSQVKAGDQLGIVEAMKLLNPIVADRGGRIRSIPVADTEMVEFGQTLFVLEPDDGPGE